MNGIQGTKPAVRQWNRLLGVVVTILKYKKSTIDHAIYIKFFDDGTVSYLTVSTDDVLNTTSNKNTFPELTRVSTRRSSDLCRRHVPDGFVP